MPPLETTSAESAGFFRTESGIPKQEQRKSVRFRPDHELVEVRVTLHKFDYSPEERALCFYNVQEVLAIQSRAERLVNEGPPKKSKLEKMRQSFRKLKGKEAKQEEEDDFRGLEALTQTGKAMHKVTVHMALHTVLTKQQGRDVERLSNVYKKVCVGTKREALDRAKQDYEATQHIWEEVNPGKTKKAHTSTRTRFRRLVSSP
eukprot:CAMPEP_0116859062 /NCGR_PEP_ID=MMETSP0418-20121206/21566_1 /TAXON_ID=1158023 /ORGANISM="Astrosyne radiata, Strain 13vi08-1A" /LENGTH=202 /DNA_ID=CAMNT_0004493147 /DNA_START=301 /DNA_END=905 /DNA_ORIENTATION=-